MKRVLLRRRHAVILLATIMMQTPAPASPPLTGPEAIQFALSQINLDEMEAQQRADIKTGKVTRRKPAVRLLGIIEGLRRNEVAPQDLMLNRVPVLPAAFRPYSAMGSTFIPGDATELYADLHLVRDTYKEAENTFGSENAGEHYLNMANAVRAVMGYGDPVRPKTKERGVAGLMKTITGSSPKWSYVQRRLISKPVDSVGRGVITVDPELGIDEIGIPEDMAWEQYKDYVQRGLVQSGMSPSAALQNVMDRSQMARKLLDREMQHRPVIYSRAPSWHKFNALAAFPKIVKAQNIAINSYVGTGMSADHDGDTINVHVPSFPESVQEAKDKLLASKMLFSIKDRDKVVPVPKHEMVLGLSAADRRPSQKVHSFASQADALRAIKDGLVPMSDEVEWAA